jgi:periplasmic protein CpxP/Spy
MTYLRNNKVLVFIIAILLLSNIAMLYFYLNKKNCEDNNKQKPFSAREWMADKLKNEVGFNDSQVAKYKELSGKHKENMKPLFEDIRLAKDSLYKLLKTEPSDSLINHYLAAIGDKQEAIDQKIFNHFQNLKHICTPDQQPKYDSIIQDVIKGMINPRRGGGDKKKDDNKENKNNK